MYLNNIGSRNKNGPSALLEPLASVKRRMTKVSWSGDYGFGSRHKETLCPSRKLTIALTVRGGYHWPLATLLVVLLVLLGQQQPGECRYLPTRSHTNDLDKLRELMLQILESNSDEEPSVVAHLSQGPNLVPPVQDHSMTGSAAENWLGNLIPWNTNEETLLTKRYPAAVNLPPLRKQMFGEHGATYF